MLKLVYFLVFSLFSNSIIAEGDIVAPQFGKKLRKMGISLSYDKNSVDKLTKLTLNKIKELELGIKESNGSDVEAEEDLTVIKYANDKFQSSLTSGVQTDIYDAYNLLMRVLYAIEARPFENRKIKIKEALKLLTRLRIKIPLLPEMNAPIGLTQAKLEAQNLINPLDSSKYMSPQELAKLTTYEIAELDISENHTFWLTNQTKKSRSNNPWTQLESWAERQVQKKLDKKKQPYTYNIHNAKKILFLTEIKNSGTSPKINTKDAFKSKWKVKWGTEIQVDPIVNDIYLKVGGRYADLTYNAREDDYLLILKEGDEDNCDNIRTLKTFKICFKKSHYKFKIDHYIHKTGLLTAKNIHHLLKDLPANPNYTKKDLIGREYITFKESLLEFKGKGVLKSVGVSSFNQFGSEMDRVRRGLTVFNHFVWNSDAKDENNKLIIAKNYDEQAKFLLETQSDLGVGLANPLPGGNINGMKTGDSFVKKKKDSISFNQWVLYEPKAWDQATYADSLWMVKKIVKLTQADFTESIDRIQWPQFMKDLLLYRLIGRRNKLAEVFEVENLLPTGEDIISPPTVEFSLKTKTDREEASKALGLSVSVIEKQLKEYDLINKRGISKHVDTLVYKGKLKPCRTTILYGLLEKNLYPTGLTRRVSRFSRFKELRDCPYIPKRKPGRL